MGFSKGHNGAGGGLRDSEIDRRRYNGLTLVLLEDKTMTGEQYIIGLERVSKKGKRYLSDKRFITSLGVKKLGFRNAKELATAVFHQPEKFKNIMGDWGI